MKNSALVVIDLQDDITKHYREIIDPVNAAIDWAVQKELWVIYTTTCPPERGPSNPARAAQSWCRS
jgi:nicotinamidase-related amidase